MIVSSTILQERLSSWLMSSNYGYIENLTGKLKELLASRINNYLATLSKDIQVNGVKQCLQITVTTKTQRAYLYEGNHRLQALIDVGIEYAPVKVIHFFLRDDADESLKFVPNKVQSFPDNPLPSDLDSK